jgi:protein-S-isoprenylcysteine O-methyltransferase Ste14
MAYLTISRILFIAFLANEALIFSRMPAEERKRVILPPLLPLMFLLLFIPFFWTIELPAWLGLVAVLLQGGGLALEIATEIQLTRAESYSVAANTPKNPQSTGVYRYLENPLYIGILAQIVGWSLWMPLVFVSLALQYVGIRRMVNEERKHLAAVNFAHRGLDSRLWN